MFACLMVFAPFVNKFILGEKPTARDLAILLGLTFPFFLLNTVASVAVNVYDLRMEWFKIFPWFIVITGWRFLGVSFAPLRLPGDLPRSLGAGAGVPIW